MLMLLLTDQPVNLLNKQVGAISDKKTKFIHAIYSQHFYYLRVHSHQ